MRVLYFNECLFVAVIFLFHIFSQCLIFTFNSKRETSMKYFLLYLQHQFISKSQSMIVNSKRWYCYIILKFVYLFFDSLLNDSTCIIFIKKFYVTTYYLLLDTKVYFLLFELCYHAFKLICISITRAYASKMNLRYVTNEI